MIATLGPNPPEATPNSAQNRRAVDAFLKIGLPKVDPSVTLMWISDPDTTAHAHGVGHPTTIEALKREDDELKRLQDGLAAAGLLERYNIWVTSHREGGGRRLFADGVLLDRGFRRRAVSVL